MAWNKSTTKNNNLITKNTIIQHTIQLQGKEGAARWKMLHDYNQDDEGNLWLHSSLVEKKYKIWLNTKHGN